VRCFFNRLARKFDKPVERRTTDQLGNPVSFSYPPSRIVSLVPSQTELLFDLGLENQIIGVTTFCAHPQEARANKAIVGGTKKFDIQKIINLKPHLVVGNKEENSQELISSLKEQVPVWISDIRSLSDAISMILSLGALTDRVEKAERITSQITENFSRCPLLQSSASALYLIWRKPWMAAGNDTFIHAMLNTIGFTNCLADQPRYPVLSNEMLAGLRPDYIFLSSEPFPFREKHVSELLKISPSSTVWLVDGEMFSWYGSRLIKSVEYFRTLLSIHG
jgi:ABC-type Fe3+-hydroxamate transport system substrate-binding protein